MPDFENDDPFIAPEQAAQTASTATPSFRTDPNQIRAWYQQYLGRGAENDSVVNSWAGQDAATAQAGIRDSAEGQAFRARQAAPAPAAAAAPTQRAALAPAAPQFQYQAPTQDPAYKAMVAALVGRALSQPNVSPDDPNIQASTAAYGADQTRASRDAISSFAERGGAHMNTDAATLAASERAGQNTANFRGALVQKNIDAERAQIQAAMNGAVGMLTAEQMTSLQQRDQELAAARFNADTSQQGWEDQYKSIFG